ncbi:MAG: DUF6067 family protein, partial [Armatimonadota bacterium]
MTVSLLIIAVTAVSCLTVFAYTDLSDPGEPWRDAEVGITDDVPYPFEPMSYPLDLQGPAVPDVGCWGRTYSLAAPFPRQIDSQGKELLAGPVAVLVERDDTITELSAGKVILSRMAPARVEFHGEMDCGPLTVSVPGSIEYDGLMDVGLTVSAAEPTEIDRLAVQIPMNPEVAMFYHYSTQWGKYAYGRVDELPEEGLDESWQACWWLGDHSRGLTFVTETWGGWTGPREKQFRMERSDEAVLLTANIINEPTTIEGERTYRIGLQATPGKPLPPTWHGRQVGQASSDPTPEYIDEFVNERGNTVALLWNSSAKYFSYPEPADPEAFKKTVQMYHDAGVRCVYYITLSSTGLASGVFQRHFEEWKMEGKDGQPLFGQNARDVDLATTDKGDWASACPRSSFSDWLVWAVDRAMEDYDLDGVYIDNPGPYYCYNQEHGCSVPGARTHPYFDVRDLTRRIYTVVHTRKPEDGIVWEHNSRTSNSLNLTFVDIYSDGEHFRVKSKGRPEQITRTFLDITGTGRQWGAQPAMLCSALNLREQYTNWLLSRLLPFGNVMFSHPNWMDFSVYSPALTARLDFGLGDEPVTWFTPDRTPEWLQYAPEDLVVGGYITEDNRMLATFSNLSDEKVALRLPLPPV